jgi:hypothetical protein
LKTVNLEQGAEFEAQVSAQHEIMSIPFARHAAAAISSQVTIGVMTVAWSLVGVVTKGGYRGYHPGVEESSIGSIMPVTS